MVHLQRAVKMSRFGDWKKFWYFTDNHITVIITIYRECYDITRNRDCITFLFSFFNLELCFKLCFREIIAGFDIDESYNYIQHYI